MDKNNIKSESEKIISKIALRNSIENNDYKNQAESKIDNDRIIQDITKEMINGQLRKLKTSGLKLFSKTNLRWVELNFEQKIFSYKINQNDSRFKKSYKLTEFIKFDSETANENKNKSKWKFSFDVKFKNRNFTFYAENLTEYNKWQNAFTRVTDIFIKYKDINSVVFKIALETFAQPYFDCLESEKLEKLANERNNQIIEIPEEISYQKKPQPKVNYAVLIGDNVNNDKPIKSDLYKDDVNKIFENELEKIEIDNKIINYNKHSNKILRINNNKNLSYKNDDFNDWSFYDEANKKIEAKNLINYNPVLKEHRKSLSPTLRPLMKGYLNNKKDMYIENVKKMILDQTKNEKKRISELTEKFGKENLQTINHLNLVLTFPENNNKVIKNENSTKQINIKNTNNSSIDLKSNNLNNQFDIFIDNDINFKSGQNKNSISKNYFDFSEKFFIENNQNHRNIKFLSKTFQKNDWDINNNYSDEHILLTQIREKEAEKKIMTMKLNDLNDKNQIKDNINNFCIPKFSATKEHLLKEINEKQKANYKINRSFYKQCKNFERNNPKIKDIIYEKHSDNESIEKEKINFYNTYNNRNLRYCKS